MVSDREETGRECSMTRNKGHLQDLDWSRLRLSGRAAFCTVSEEDNKITICNKYSRDQRREKGSISFFISSFASVFYLDSCASKQKLTRPKSAPTDAPFSNRKH